MIVFTASTLRHDLSPTRTLKWPGRSRVQTTRKHIGRLSRATCHVPRGRKGQLASFSPRFR